MRTKKTISLLLSLLMIVSTMYAMPFEAFADELSSGNFRYTVQEDDTVCITRFTDENAASVNVPEELDGRTVTAIGNNAFAELWELKNVVLPNTLKSIGNGAFYYTSLTDISIPESVTSIGNYAFKDCDITNITLPKNLTVISEALFAGCTHLKEVEIPNGVTEIGARAFEDNAFKSINLPNGITEIGEKAFNRCSNLTDVNIPNGLTKIKDETFFDCYALKSVQIPNSVTSIGNYAFSYCEKLASVEIPGSVTVIGNYAFKDCDALKSVQILNGVTEIGTKAFYDCPIYRVLLPESVTTVGEEAFSGSYYYPELVQLPSSITSLGNYAFGSEDPVKYVYYSGSEEQWNAVEKGSNGVGFSNATINYNYNPADESVLQTGSCGNNISYTLNPVTGLLNISGTGNMTNYRWATTPFGENKIIETVVISDGITSVGSALFTECSNILSVSIPESVTNIGDDAFYFCGCLKDVNIPAGLTYLGEDAFYGCESVTSLVVPEGITEIYDSTFCYCRAAAEISIPSSVTSIGNSAFFDCSTLTEMNISKNVTSIGNSAFNGCDSITAYTVDKDNPAYCSEDGVLFTKDMTTLIKYPNANQRKVYNVPVGVVTIGNYAFEDNYYVNKNELTNITVPNGVTAIGDYAFANCQNLTSVSLPSGLTSLDSYAFDACKGLKDVYFGGNEEEWATVTVNNASAYLKNATVHYNSCSVHNMDEGEIVKEANCRFTGTIKYSCKNCEYSYTEEIPADANKHRFVNGSCMDCGIDDPDYVTPSVQIPVAAEITLGGTCPYYVKFTAVESKTIKVYTTGDDDTYGVLYDENENYLTNNDDGGESRNFLFTYKIEEGKTYLLQIVDYSLNHGYDDNRIGSVNYVIEYDSGHQHTYDDGVITLEATCTKDGVKTFTCATCTEETQGHSYTDPIPATGHSMTLINAKNANCGEAGNNAYYVCNNCKEYFKDEEGLTVTTVKAETIAATGKHTWDSGKVTKAATPTATGVKTFTCTVCKKTKTETIAKCDKYKNPLTVKAKAVNVKFNNLKKKNQVIKQKNAVTVSKAQGKVTYAKTSGNKKITVNKKNGNITVAKGLKKGTYKIKIKITAAGNSTYKAGSKTVTVTIKVK